MNAHIHTYISEQLHAKSYVMNGTRIKKILHRDDAAALARGQKRTFVEQICKVGSGESSRPRFRGSMGIANLHISHRARALRIGETHLGDSSVDRGLTTDEADIRTVGMKEHEP